MAQAELPTDEGEFRAVVYESVLDDEQHLALVLGDVDGKEDVLVRVHSECLTGDVFGSQRCDCGTQLQAALDRIAAEGTRGRRLPARARGPRDRPRPQDPRLRAARGRP